MPGLCQVCRCPAASQRLACPARARRCDSRTLLVMRGGKGLNNMDEPVKHGPRSLFVLGTLPLCSRHRGRGGRETTTTAEPGPDHQRPPPPPPVSTVSPLDQDPLELAPLAHRTTRPSAMASMGSTRQPSSTPKSICRLIRTSLASPFPPSPALLLQLSWALCCFCSWPLSVLSFSCCNGSPRLQSHSFKLLSLLSPCSSHPFFAIVHHLDNPLDSHHHTL